MIKLENITLEQTNVVDMRNPAIAIGSVLTIESGDVISRYEIVKPEDAERFITVGDVELPIRWVRLNK